MKNLLSENTMFRTLIKKIVPVKIKKLLATFRNKKHLSELDKKGYYVICHCGIGDILAGAVLAKEKANGRRVIMIVKENMRDLLDELEYVDDLIADTSLVLDWARYCIYNGIYEGDNWIYGHFHKDFTTDQFIMNCELVWDDYCVNVYHLPKGRLKATRNINNLHVTQKQLGENDIVICPHANSLDKLNMKFWEKLVDYLIYEKKYVVYTNIANGNEVIIKHTYPLNVPLNDICSVVNNAKLVISFRSGICDLLAMNSNARMIVIYPSKGLKIQWDVEYFRNENIYSLVFNSDTETEIKAIIETI